MANDRKRKIRTRDTRVEVIHLLESAKSLRDVAAQFVCGKTQDFANQIRKRFDYDGVAVGGVVLT